MRLDLRAVTREYKKEGETKRVYATIGSLWTDDDGKPQSIQLDLTPVNWDGKAFVSEPYDKDRPMKQHEALEKTRDVAPNDIDDKPIDLSEIPF